MCSFVGHISAHVIRQERSSADGHIWYVIGARINDSHIQGGWIRSDTVTQVESCPAFQ